MKAAASRIAGLVAVLVSISVITFTLNYFAPGDKAMIIAAAFYPDATGFPDALLQQIREEHRLGDPFLAQYGQWVANLLRGDFGTSYTSGAPVWDVFLGSLGETVALTLSALGLGLTGAVLLAGLAVRNPGTLIDRFAIFVASIGAAIPGYWLALLLIMGVSVHLGWLPAYGTGTPAHLVLPACTLALWVMASQTRLLRSFLLDAYAQPFIETLRLRGISEREIFLSHVIPHARIPALTMIGLDLASLLEGAVIVELVFSRAGLGSLLAASVLSRDLPMTMFLVMFFATTYVVINTAIDAVQALADPRTRPAEVAR
ncbi:ABC transporter permease [Pontivivens ytuae]|uniref:ABC transporter permease n=1 Tax=Pontivivens ytuae TaxID=2789856 RepID=A0A7S9LUR5_9RHOB|nr:ABC transporter permease [Pontivivens ytuae]QPH55619.1 ABC transporter permease [Pontivivens ytuae]